MTTTTVGPPTFLSAVLAATEDPFRLIHGDDATDVTQFAEANAIIAGADAAYLSPVTSTGMVPFLYSFTENAQREQWRDDVLSPTAVLFKDDALICIYALDTAVDRQTADPVAEAMNGFLDDPIPLPGAWELVHLDEQAFHPFDTLADLWSVAPAVVQPVEFGTLNDATLLTPFRLDDPRYTGEITVSIGKNRESKVWAPKPMPVWTFVDMLSRHREDKKKDGVAFVLAEIVGNQRKKSAVKACYGVGLDIDVGVSGAVIDEALVGLGCLAVRYTTHSHAKTSTKLLKDRIAKWCKKHDLAEGVTQDTVVRFLREESRWDEAIIKTVEYVDDVHDPEGFMVQIDHIPMPKHRVVLPLAQPFVPTAVAKTHDEGMKMWGDVCRALAKALGDLPLDRSAVDPSRLFSFPRHVAARPFETRIVGGDLLDWKTLDLSGADAEPGTFEALLEADLKAADTKKSKSTTEQGQDLGHWSKVHADRFQIVDLIKDHAEDRIRTNGAHKIDIECPFDEEHSNPGDPEDTGCFAVNAGDGSAPVFVVKCQHDACANRTNLDHLGKMLKDGWFDQAALDDANYYSEPDDDAPVVVKGAAAPPPSTGDIKAAIAALPPKDDAPDVTPVLAMIARLDDDLEREGMMRLVQKASGIAVGKLRGRVAELRKIKAKPPSGVDSDVVVDPKTGFRTLTFKGVHDDIRARGFLIDTMNRVNKAANMPLFSINRGAPAIMRRYDGQISFEELEPKTFQAALFEHCAFAEHVDEGDLTRKVPDANISNIVHAGLRDGELPDQPSIRRAPTIGPDGQVMKSSGWFGDVVVDLGKLEAPDVPDNPTTAQVQAARDLLVNTVFGDFPFDDDDDLGALGKSKASTANAVGMTLTQFCRDLFTGPSPLFAIVKPAPGVGGTLLAEVPQRLFDGFASTTTPNSSREEEMEKLMSSAAMGNESCMFFDNVRNFNSDTVKRTCTNDQIGGRMLGSSKMVYRPNTLLWQITGINPTLDAEINRRCVYMNLNLRRASSAKRVYQHPDFKVWLGENRSKIIGAILTLIRAWWVAGRKPGTTVLASFESWSKVIGGILEHAGIEGFLTNPRPETEDHEGAETKEFVIEWLSIFQDREASEKKAFEAMVEDAGFNVEDRRRKFNTMVRSLKGRTFEIDNRLMMFAPGSPGCWRVVEIKAVTS